MWQKVEHKGKRNIQRKHIQHTYYLLYFTRVFDIIFFVIFKVLRIHFLPFQRREFTSECIQISNLNEEVYGTTEDGITYWK